MPLIHRMSDDLANQIAAGEVVERPASAVKELVENALDAGATDVRVELEDGGLSLIRVADNGSGMSREDAPLAVERHATSKLRSAEDLFAIRTLGFRGEALPSIASVSRFELLTRRSDDLEGTRVTLDGGGVPRIETAGCPVGTQISVRDLFFNTPARRKFMRTGQGEARQVQEGLARVAMMRPDVAFSLVHNGRTLLDLGRVSDPVERVMALVGRDDGRHLYPILPLHRDGVDVSGWFAAPSVTRRTGDSILTFVNGRYIRDRRLQMAVRVGYEQLVDRGRFPVAVIAIDIEPHLVDVNVHPMKIEVRFRDADTAFGAVRRALLDSLARAPWVGAESAGAHAGLRPGPRAAAEGSHGTQETLPVRDYILATVRPGAGGATAPSPIVVSPMRRGDASAPASGLIPPHRGAMASGATHRTWATGGSAATGDAVTGESARDGASDAPWTGGAPTGPAMAGGARAGVEQPPAPGDGFFTHLHYIGHYRGTYLLASDARGLVVVDQHAAHERITFENLRDAWRERRAQSQPLLFPQTLSFDSLRVAALEEHADVFARLGYDLEPFGGLDVALRGVPAILGRARHDELLRDAVDELRAHGASHRVDEAVDAVLLRMACHGSVRAGQVLHEREVRALFEDLDRIDFGGNCPHGRPVYFRMTLEELEKRFERR